MNRCLVPGVAALVLFAGCLPPAFADGCGKEDLGSGRPFVSRAQAAENSGNFKAAFDAIRHVPACAPDVDFKQLNAMRLRVARRLGGQEEKQGRYESAAHWFRDAESLEDADRAMDEWGKSASRDPDVFEKVFRYFDNGRPDDARLKELRRIAAHNANEELANEDKAFPVARDTTDLLNRARRWMRYVEGGEKKVLDRAAARGDARAKDESPATFQSALAYYRYARDTQRESRLRDRAVALAEAHERKGEPALAVQYYQIAGRHDKASTLQKQTRAQVQKDESTRKKNFATDQKALEKELGF
jgi:hypothetical protein